MSKRGVLGTGQARRRGGVLGTGQVKKGGVFTAAHTCVVSLCVLYHYVSYKQRWRAIA